MQKEGKSDAEIVEQLICGERWDEAEGVIKGNLVEPIEDHWDNHWWLARLSAVYYERHNYAESLAVIEKARLIAPNCPLVLWDYAGSLDMLGREEEATKIWKFLLRKGIKKIAFDECGEGVRWAESLLNDCLYRIGLSYYRLGRKVLAVKYIKQHIAQRRPGLPSIYRLRAVKKKLQQIENS
jgi:tetratricopeptide (TPR) repeat protein